MYALSTPDIKAMLYTVSLIKNLGEISEATE
mgnify:CR=1 FL=1